MLRSELDQKEEEVAKLETSLSDKRRQLEEKEAELSASRESAAALTEKLATFSQFCFGPELGKKFAGI